MSPCPPTPMRYTSNEIKQVIQAHQWFLLNVFLSEVNDTWADSVDCLTWLSRCTMMKQKRHNYEMFPNLNFASSSATDFCIIKSKRSEKFMLFI